ncbi:DUF2383 domain-containing protein [Methylobacter svalbardensis]|uniref:DUF2383 domain-containing protein n=1 Tax=Methylobacter svalbardensis TaxID=3080016 RepID=UPI0030ED1E94
MAEMKRQQNLGESTHLQPIYAAHKNAVSSFQALIHRLGGIPCEDSGAWGTWAKIVLEGANILGKKVALKTLLEGEKSGAKDYEKVLQDAELSSDVRALIETKLLPEQQSHIRTLDRLLDTAPE